MRCFSAGQGRFSLKWPLSLSLSIIIPFDFLFVTGEHRIRSCLFEEAALAAPLDKEKKMQSRSDRFAPMYQQNSITKRYMHTKRTAAGTYLER